MKISCKKIIAGLLFGALAVNAAELGKWTCKLLPLPHEIKITGTTLLAAQDIFLGAVPGNDSQLQYAAEILRKYAHGTKARAKLSIRLALSNNPDALPDKLRKRLESVPNNDQAYVIHSTGKFPKNWNITVAGRTSRGVLYGVRTLAQLLAPKVSKEGGKLEVPCVEIVDWPDVRYRGLANFMGSYNKEKLLAWFGEMKLNIAETCDGGRIDGKGNPIVYGKKELADYGWRRGVSLTPHFSHPDAVAKSLAGALHNPKLSSLKPMFAKGKNGRQHANMLSFSNPLTQKYFSEWFMKIAEIYCRENHQFIIWLTEDSRTHHRCAEDMKICRKRGITPFQLEVETLLKSLVPVRKAFPGLRVWFMLTQATTRAKAEKDIIKMLPPGVGLIWYDGVLTYRTDRRAIIPKVLADFAASGKPLGETAQIQNDIRSTVPMSSPQFVRFRIRELYDKKGCMFLPFFAPTCMIVPLNMAATAEYCWNLNGRSVKDFATAYANCNGIANSELFGRWADAEGRASWLLAETGLFRYITRAPELNIRSCAPFKSNYGGMSKMNPVSSEDLDKAIKTSGKAVEFARKCGDRRAIAESNFTLAGLVALKTVKELFKLTHRQEKMTVPRKKASAKLLDQLDICANTITRALFNWNDFVLQSPMLMRHKPSGRFMSSVIAFHYTADAARELGRMLGFSDPFPEMRPLEIYRWRPADFKNSRARIEIDITGHIVKNGGEYLVTFDNVDYDREARVVVLISKVSAVAVFPDGKKRVIAVSPDAWGPYPRVPATSYYTAVRLKLPPLPKNAKIYVKVDFAALCSRRFPEDYSPENRHCAGIISLRRMWKQESFPAERKTVLTDMKNETSDSEFKNLRPVDTLQKEIAVSVLETPGAKAIAGALAENKDFKVKLIPALTDQALRQTRVLVVPQLSNTVLYNRPDNSRRLSAWVRNGGGIMLTHDAVGYRGHTVIFRNVGAGVSHPKGNKVRVAANHPVTAGLPMDSTFYPGFKFDQVVMEKGPAGKVLLRSEEPDKRAVLVAGEMGKGRIILNGMLTGFSGGFNSGGGREHKPSGEESVLLQNGVKWLAGK